MKTHFVLTFLIIAAIPVLAQDKSNEHVFSQAADQVKRAIDTLPGGRSGPLPTLEGFVVPGMQDVERYQRPYYQCEVRVIAQPSGGSLVRVSAKITAWQSTGAHSGYVMLKSSGRLEADLLDRLQKAVSNPGSESVNAADNPKMNSPEAPATSRIQTQPEISAPTSQFPKHLGWIPPDAKSSQPKASNGLEQEARNLEDILRNQAHPTNLVAVKFDQTPVLQAPSLDAKVLFIASSEDEFEILDTTPDWVHVRISGLSRGWLRKSALQLLNDPSDLGEIRESSNNSKQAPRTGTGLFTVSSEEVGTFPGDWASLRGKNVKIVSVQQAPGTGRITSPLDKVQFAESIFRKEDTVSGSGLVVIFDSEDGGMVAAANSSIEQLKKGMIGENDFWKQCYIDPPEMLGSIQ